MTRDGALYLYARQQSGVTRAIVREEPRDAVSQLTAARLLRLGGTGGKLPPNYFGDAPSGSEATPKTSPRTP